MSDSISNLLRFYNMAWPREVDEGRAWYPYAHEYSTDLATEFKVSVRLAAAVISILSPRNRWERNLEDAYNVLDFAINHYRNVGMIPVVGTFHKMRDKAIQAVHYRKPELAETSPKTRAFVNTIVDPTHDIPVVDVWMYRAINNDPRALCPSLSEKIYDEYAEYVIAGAEMVGELVSDFQAIVWTVVRNMGNDKRQWLTYQTDSMRQGKMF